MEALKSTHIKMNLIVAERRVLKVPMRNISLAADQKYKLGEGVLVFSERKNWICPFEFIHVEEE